MLHRALLVVALLCICVATPDVEHMDEDMDGWQDQNRFRDADFRRDREHLREHMGEMDMDFDTMPHEEVEFQFFKLHDLDNDNRLDGLEILSALRHSARDQVDRLMSRNLPTEELTRRMSKITERLANTVDIILEDDDENEDGYLTYSEYVRSYRAAEELGG